MKKINCTNRIILIMTSILFIPCLNSCGIISDIFEAGVWIGVIVTIVVIALIAYIIIKIIQSIF